MRYSILLAGVILAAAVAFRSPTDASAASAIQEFSVPRFLDSERRGKLEAILPEIDREFREYSTNRNYPGLVWGIVLDGELVHSGAVGYANIAEKIPVSTDTVFRIASMTKSFTAMAIMKLRDAGKLALHDPVRKYLPAMRHTPPLTADAPPITLRHLLTMSAGFPEDNPWGDRQLADPVPELQAFLREGLALSNPPGIAYEYSNLGYALLGQVITRVAGMPYQRYITRHILRPLGMTNTFWEYADVPPERLALGYRRIDGSWRAEPMLHDGTYGAMGGLLTTMNDFARYVSLHLDAWPPRNDPDDAVVSRATLREMHQPAMFSGIAGEAKSLSGEPLPTVSAYGYGLAWMNDSRGTVRIGHSGGLPGFGSNYRFYPEHGFAVISFANLTYASTSAANAKVGALIVEKAGLPRRMLPPSAILETRKNEIVKLVQTWDSAIATAVVAENFFLDHSREEWIVQSRATLDRAGAIRSVGAIVVENQLRGTFPMVGERGRVDVFFTLTPERNPRLQELRLRFVAAQPVE